MRTFFGKRVEHDPRHAPAAGPAQRSHEVIAMVGKAHHIERLGQVGGVRLSGSVNYVSSRNRRVRYSTTVR